MAGIQDPLTDLPPPSRFDFDELSNFAFSAPPQPPPSIAWSPSAPLQEENGKLRTGLLLLSTAAAGCHILHHLPHKRLIGSIVLPEAAVQQKKSSSSESSLSDRACYLYALNDDDSVVLVSVQYSVPAERAYAWTKVLLDLIEAEDVLVLAAVPSAHFRGKISADERLLFRLETDQVRTSPENGRCSIPYYPSGSLVDGVPAAVLSHRQLRKKKARLILLWPDAGSSAVAVLVSALQESLPGAASGMNFSQALKVPFKGKSPSNLEIYF